MNKILLSLAAFAVMAAPAVASAEQCRSAANGKFAKCGTAGAVPASQYVKKDGAKGKAMPSKAAPAKPAAAAPAAKPVVAAPAAKPAAPAKKGPCKDAKGKFIKCAA